jgi:hypothetical protein
MSAVSENGESFKRKKFVLAMLTQGRYLVFDLCGQTFEMTCRTAAPHTGIGGLCDGKVFMIVGVGEKI